MAKRKTKIVATIGPACSAEKPLRRVIEAGVDVCRLNFSHGTHDSHSAVLERIRRISSARSTYAVEETPNPTALPSIPRLIEHLRDSRSVMCGPRIAEVAGKIANSCFDRRISGRPSQTPRTGG